MNKQKHNKLVAAMRGISLDAINNAKQGHIGMALGTTNVMANLIGHVINFTDRDAKWINRDRLILSAGHGSLTIYSIYNFLGLLSKQDLIDHKKWNSKTPSHPEIDKLKYIDASTGPLGQGVAMGVGMAIAQEYLKEKFNKENYQIIDNNIFVVHGDGCLQEGVALEAIQLAGTLGLNKLILIHDYNDMQIDSSSKEVNNVNFKKYFESLNFNVIILKNDDSENFLKAIENAKKSNKPTYIQVKTIIAKGTTFENKSIGHNGTLSPEDTIKYKKELGLKNFVPFEYSDEVYQYGKEILNNKRMIANQWFEKFSKYKKKYPKLAQQLLDLKNNKVKMPNFNLKFPNSNLATRDYIKTIMEYLDEKSWNIIGGSADLKAACKVGFSKNILENGKNIQYGIREFAMSAINNGISLYSNLKTVDATFLVFADYAKSALRLASMMHLSNVRVYTHDSYQVGGDGPTHQPIEQLAMLRTIPNFKVIRPCDETEMLLAFKMAFNSKKTQHAIIACRQPLKSFNKLEKKLLPAYVLVEKDCFDLSLLASGSEVALAEEVLNLLAKNNFKAQLISVPILNVLVNNEKLIKELKIHEKPIFAIEASNDPTWYKLAKWNKFNGQFSQEFGASADGQIVYKKHGFDSRKIVKKILNWLS